MPERRQSALPVADGGEIASPVAVRKDVAARVLMAIGLLFVAIAVVVAAYPQAYATWRGLRADQQFTAEYEAAAQYDLARVDALIEDAMAYNGVLAGNHVGAGPVASYENQLRYDDGAEALCWLDIPSLGIKLPVYRDDGTDGVSPEGAEHVRGTSLPVGGESSNTVITAHSGSHRGAPMAFNRIDSLEYGDLIVMWTLGRPYAYRVCSFDLVDPADVSNLEIVAGLDRLTLLTCRPIGTTAQRLFVCAQRCEYASDDAVGARVEVLLPPGLPQFVALLVAAGLILWVVLLIASRAGRGAPKV